MTKQEVCGQWKSACACIKLKGQWVRNGNTLDISHVLRHKDCDTAEMTVVEDGPSTILEVKPVAPKDVPQGKSVSLRPAFYLIVT